LDPTGGLCAVSARSDVRAFPSASDASAAVFLLNDPEPRLASIADLDAYLARQFLPWCRVGERLVIATADMSAENLAWIGAAYKGAHIAAMAPSDLRATITRRFCDRLSEDAVYGLLSKKPHLSACAIVTRNQAVVLCATGVVVAIACSVWPHAIVQILVAFMSVGFAVSTLFRAVLAWLGLDRRTVAGQPVAVCSDDGLPIYTILVPLYREAAALPELARSLLALDYPRDKLDIKFVVEEDDAETCAMAQALATRGHFEIVRVPHSLPRTKPKACNYALRFARGEYLVIYDAEDRPESDQLRKAVASFRQHPRKTACLQARLDIYNANETWLSRMFALDYSIWFKALLPGLDRYGVPMPLGGTSNHFRTSLLREVCGWDPFNVTEDADLGIRLAQLGYRVSMLDSTTFEEAPSRLGPWLRQRSRWLKGYMQTCLVHMREPIALTKRVGVRGVAVIQLFIGGVVWSALVNPVLWLIFLVSCIQAQANGETQIVETLARISGLGLLTANTLLGCLALTGSRRATQFTVIAYGLTFMFYWMLVSIAAYRGLWQLIRKPFYWEKTPHGHGRMHGIQGS